MLNGIRLIFYRFLEAIILIIVLSPIMAVIRQLAVDLDYDHFMGAQSILLIGLDMIYFILIFGIVGAIWYLYYRLTKQRRYERSEEMFFPQASEHNNYQEVNEYNNNGYDNVEDQRQN